MRIENHVEAQIREARENGAFDDLPGAGRPLPDLGVDDPLWWVKGMPRREGLEPPLTPALELRSDVARTLERLRALDPRRGESHVREELERMNERIRKANRTSWRGPPTTLAPLDVEAWLARWRADRDA